MNVIAITKDGEFVFVHQYRYAIGETLYEICAGVVENGGTFIFSKVPLMLSFPPIDAQPVFFCASSAPSKAAAG